MDLDFRADRAAANRVLSRYIGRTGDADLTRGLPPFLSSRALIRAHVAARSGKTADATRYLARAHEYLRPVTPLIVAVGGLPGTGKTTLARALAPGLGATPGAVVLRSDEIRKRLCGVAPEERLPPAAYKPEVSARVFSELADLAYRTASSGHAAIADATFMDPDHRALIEDSARRAGVGFVGLWLEAPLPALEARVAARTGDASDATVDVVRSAARHDPGAGDWVPIDASDATRARHLATEALRPYLALT